MIEINKPKAQQTTQVIRTASSYELTLEEKEKLAKIDDLAEPNVIERISVNGELLEPVDKQIDITLGNLATTDVVTPQLVDPNSVFIIECVPTK